ncbi:MAG TPA: class I SAM-dependent methyltransferase [Baekduia sp.]|nr:class I SAM-dependent methyltransferase [Baekduia sp.]
MEELAPWSVADGWTTAQTEKWRQLARTWNEAPAPASPSDDDLERFVALAERYVRADGAIALMGCTPSLRRALSRSRRLSGARLYCVDFSADMWAATTALVEEPHPGERFVQRAWQELASALPEPVDVVLGDKTLDNVEFARWPETFAAVHEALRPGGHLIVHVGLVVRDPVPLDVGAVVGRWAARVRAGEVVTDTAAAGAWEDLLTGSIRGEDVADPYKLTIAGFGDELRAIAERADPGSAEARVLARLRELFGSSLQDSWTAFTLEELLRAAGERFLPRAAYWSTDYDVAPLQPIVDLEARPGP